MTYTLPETVEVGGRDWAVRWDYRPILDILSALSDPELDNEERSVVLLDIFYPEFDSIPVEDYQEAVDKCLWFINGGEDQQGNDPGPKLMDWKQDFNLIVAPINRVIGGDIRSSKPLHWFTFISAYQEIGDCTFAQVVRIRDKKARGKSLDKQDREWYRRNQKLVDLKKTYTTAEKDLLKEWGGG